MLLARVSSWLVGPAIVLLAAVLAGCATVPQNRREHLADPTMQLTDDPLEARSDRKFHMAREGAAGGDAQAAGGGCACGN